MPEQGANGRFVKGNKGGPGRPRGSAANPYREATLSKVSVERWEHIVDKAIEDAESGDKHARRWLGEYLVGRPSTPSVVGGVGTALLERLIDLLRATDHQPEQVFESLITRLEQEQEARRLEYRNNA